MVRLDLSYFYRLGASFDEVKQISATADFDTVWLRLYDLRQAVRQILADKFLGVSLRGAVASGQALIAFLDQIMDREGEEEKWNAYDRNNLIGHVNRFEIVLTSEIAVADAYFVVEKSHIVY